MYKKGRKAGTIRFSYTPLHNHAKAIAVAGDFNNWEPTRMKKQKNGSYAVTLDVEPGRYEYKFQIDDVWQLDPDHDENVVNEFGTLNSVATID